MFKFFFFGHSEQWLDVGFQLPEQGLTHAAVVKTPSPNHTRELPSMFLRTAVYAKGFWEILMLFYKQRSGTQSRLFKINVNLLIAMQFILVKLPFKI